MRLLMTGVRDIIPLLAGEISSWSAHRAFIFVQLGVDVRDYELVMIISPEVADESVPATVERVQGFIQGRGGEVKEVNPWGRRKLAYPIERHTEGHYVVTQFRLDPQTVIELEGNLKLSEDVIRHLVVKLGE